MITLLYLHYELFEIEKTYRFMLRKYLHDMLSFPYLAYYTENPALLYGHKKRPGNDSGPLFLETSADQMIPSISFALTFEGISVSNKILSKVLISSPSPGSVSRTVKLSIAAPSLYIFWITP